MNSLVRMQLFSCFRWITFIAVPTETPARISAVAAPPDDNFHAQEVILAGTCAAGFQDFSHFGKCEESLKV